MDSVSVHDPIELQTGTGPHPAIQHPEGRWRRRIRRAFALATGAYGVGLTLFLIVRLLVDARFEPVQVVNSFLHLLLMPSLALLPLSLLMRRWRLALCLAPAALAFLLSYGSVFLPRPAPAVAPDAPQLTLVTFNLHSEREALEPLSTLIRETDADVVALQELSTAAATHFTTVLAAAYPYQALNPHSIPSAGQGVLSRYPILADEYWRNDDLYFVSRGHQRVELDVDGTTVTLYNVHPPNPFLYRNPLGILVGRGYSEGVHRQALDDVLGRAGEETGPLILAGDFNMSDQNVGYGRLTEHYSDAYREVGWGMGFTYPDWSTPSAAPGFLRTYNIAIYPLVRLDYIFHNDAIRALEARVWPTAGSSDHRPVWARLAVVGE